ncbi:unnamed protein product [Clonostachys rosea f. rosea IK726]|uniref:AMP-dependent synthetase/ligase domain-containing protein n=2 Tax=Bionectria ochroleuca TaxID=29856 RepID=A0A0B7KBS7_BIOOC|nr:unnamed protein product [Clonostachys rosea f. rosea IK726]
MGTQGTMNAIVKSDSSEHSLAKATYMFGPKNAARFSTVTEAFLHFASKQPTQIAARSLSSAHITEVTYSELLQRANELAQRLRKLGVAPGSRVPLIVKRGVEMITGILAILLCGAQYVPLDGGVVPDTTLRYVIEQAGGRSCTVLTLKSLENRLHGFDVANVLPIDARSYSPTPDQAHPLKDLAEPDLGCYVIYTSGTTGTPKGVDVTHRNVTNLVCQSPGDLGIVPGTRVGQVLNISFDMAAWEMLGCLCNGGTLILRGSKWQSALSQIDVLICTPSILAKYEPSEFPNIKVAATAGEPSSQKLADTWASAATYYNCCGPTETTIVNTMHRHQPGQPLTIGKPTSNNNVYILGDDNRPVPFGATGLMWAGGLGVSKGYVSNPEKTAERYLADPFAADGSMMYNTGDLGRWNPDGTIDIVGRQDDQVKIKGFRVELDGVTTSLNSCPAVDRAAVILVGGELHAFVTPMTCDEKTLREHMGRCQPYYAVPSHFHCVDALPLTPNGKIDKRTLGSASVAFCTNEKPLSEPEMPKEAFVPVRAYSSDYDVPFQPTPSTTSASSMTSSSSFDEKMVDEKIIDLEAGVPNKLQGKRQRGLKHRVLIVYRQLFSIVGIFNIAAIVALLLTGAPREWLGNITAINLVVAVLIRQDFVINALYTITCSVPKSWPLWIRTKCARIFHLGGVHSSAAFCSALWLLAGNISDIVCMCTGTCSEGWGQQSVANKTISWILAAGFAFMICLAYPPIRKSKHNLFERSHRFTGWTMLGLFWVQTVLTANDSKPEGMSLGEAVAKSPPMWLLVVATMSIAMSWLWLRKVPVDAEVFSNHAVRLHFDYTVPVNGSFTRLSHSPLLEWHSFATVPAPTAENGRPAGYSVVVSNAGDWTKDVIQNPPKHLWVRGVPTCGVMRIATCFNRVVLIATGSGIGPLLGHIQAPSCPTQLIWSTPKPEETFGKALCDTIRKKVPNAVIHDTRTQGRPDLVKMGYNMAKGFGAEAVIIIANEKITKKVVYGLETRGIPTYGAIWDS